MLWGLGVHVVSGKIQARPRRTCSMAAFFPWQASERLCEKACGMSFICARVVVLGQSVSLADQVSQAAQVWLAAQVGQRSCG